MTQPPYPQHRPPVPGRPRGSHVSHETRRDVEAALAAQRELGPEYGDQIAAGLADRVEQLAAYRTAELRQAAVQESEGSRYEHIAQRNRFVTAIVSLGAGIPITGIAVAVGGLPETLVCWAGIVGVNVAQSLSSRRRR
jgi:hypothetical protein